MNIISEIGFIGFGLIGGSIAKALKQDSNAFHIIVFDHHKDQKSPGLLAAKAHKRIISQTVKSLYLNRCRQCQRKYSSFCTGMWIFFLFYWWSSNGRF